MSAPELKVVPDEEAISMLQIWKSKGHDPAASFRILGVRGALFAGVEDYIDGNDVVLIPESMAGISYETSAKLYAALGSLLDQAFPVARPAKAEPSDASWVYEPKARTITIPAHLDGDFHDWQVMKTHLAFGQAPDGRPLTENGKEIMRMRLDNAARALLLDFESIINDLK